MRKGEMAAVVFITSKPVDAFVRGRWEPGFKFLPVNYDSKFEDYYLPAVLEAGEYPGLIKQGERVSTIAVPTALVAFNWPAQDQPPSARRALCRYAVFPHRQAAGAGLRPEMEVDQSRCDSPRPRSLCRGAGMAGSSGARTAGVAMKAIPLSVAFEVASGVALAQGAADPMAHLRACSVMEQAERLQCLDGLSRDIAAPGRSAADGDNWIISETTSPVNYTPIVTATAFSRGGSDGALMQLAIHCRGGRTELVVSGPAVSAVARITPFPTASMTVSRCNLRPVRHRLEPVLRSRATSCACCSRSPRTVTSPFASRPAGVAPRPWTDIFRSAD